MTKLYECTCPGLNRSTLPFRDIAEQAIAASTARAFPAAKNPHLVFAVNRPGGFLAEFRIITALAASGYQQITVISIEPEIDRPSIAAAYGEFRARLGGRATFSFINFTTQEAYRAACAEDPVLRFHAWVTIDPDDAPDRADFEDQDWVTHFSSHIAAAGRPLSFWAFLQYQPAAGNDYRHFVHGIAITGSSTLLLFSDQYGETSLDHHRNRAFFNSSEILPFDPITHAVQRGGKIATLEHHGALINDFLR